jgi:dTDP-4-amino-4,6-dideoxygalactose transaminase
MSEFHAAILLAATDALDSQWRLRTAMAERLTEELGHESGVDPPAVLPEVTRMSWYMYCVRPAPGQADRSNVESAAAAGAIGLPVTRMYPPFHELPAYATSCAPFRGTCPEAELAGREVVCVAHRVLLAEPQLAASIAGALAASIGLTG